MLKKFLKSKIAIIGGGNFNYLNILKGVRLKSISTPYGKVFYYLIGNFPLILRHGLKKNIPPHKINYKANIFALKKLRRKFIFSFNSVGSLKRELKPGMFLIPSDYISLTDSITFYNKVSRFITPEISPKLRKILARILRKLKLKFKDKGVYFETRGPRLETKAEIKIIKNFADVVGMTMAKEATLAKELDIEYASLCSIDNFAHGISKKTLTQAEIEKNQKKNAIKIEKIIKEILDLEIK